MSDIDYGPLSGLIGSWTGEQGQDLAPQPDGTEQNAYTETITFSQSLDGASLLLTSGLYDAAGDFAYRVGLPGKSGVGGGIVAVIPGQLAVTVWSPGLNESGNSKIGLKALELFTTYTGISVF